MKHISLILVWSHMASAWRYDAPYVGPIRRWLKSPGVACEAVGCRWSRYWRRRTAVTMILESDDELELGAPKRYEKLYLVTVSKS